MPAAIETQDLTRCFGAITALDRVTLAIAPGEFFSLLGPSGCGKTTLLRLIAGLDLPDAGALHLNGSDALNLPAHRRPVNTVFQSYALFPHLTVEENVAFGLKMKKVSPSEIPGRVRRALEMVDIAALAGRRPAQLSGGQKQRVALARAVINEPQVLLLDEPLGALDLKLRRQLQIELQQLQKRLGITFVYVTHDQEEAMAMSDRIAVMNQGRIEQLGAPDEVYDRPRTRFVAEFLGSCNIIEGTAHGGLVKTALGDFPIGGASGKIILTVRPEHIRLQKPGPLTGRIVSVVYGGAQTQYGIECCGHNLKASVPNGEGGQKFRSGDEVAIEIPPDGLRILTND